MADYLEMLRGLFGAFSPGEAEAKVVARDPQAQAVIDAVRSGATLPEEPGQTNPLITGHYDPLRKRVYKNVLTAAEGRPETVSVGYGDDVPEGAAAAYWPLEEKISLRPFVPAYPGQQDPAQPIPTGLHDQNLLSHELLHFLMKHFQMDANKLPDTQLVQKLGRQSKSPMLDWLYGVKQGGPGVTDLRNAIPDMFRSDTMQHAFIRYLHGDHYSPATLDEYTQNRPFTKRPPMYGEDQRLVAEAALRQILQDPALLKQALSGLQDVR